VPRIANRWFLLLLLEPALAIYGQAPSDLVRASSRLITEIQAKSDRAIPESILDRADCIGVVPETGNSGSRVGDDGRGVISCATSKGWSAPLFFRVGRGSLGTSYRGALVLLFVNEKARDKLSSSEVVIGGDAASAAGPVGREASTDIDASIRADILSYSFSRSGLKSLLGSSSDLSGTALDGAVIRPDAEDNERFYGRLTTPKEIIDGKIPLPISFQAPPFPPIPPPPPPRKR